jgi:hypothetical protein
VQNTEQQIAKNAELLHASERIARIAENPLLKREAGHGFVDRLSGAARLRRRMVDRMRDHR